MSAYVRQLNKALEQANAKLEAEKEAEKQAAAKAEAEAARDRLVPLVDRVAKLLTTIPIDVQREGVALASLQTMLKGRQRGRAHPGEIGEALRKLGFVRRRCWRGPDGFSAKWYPAT